MNKIVEIVTAWARAANPTPEQKELATLRYSMCKGCEWNKPNKMFSENCSLCWCPLEKKIFTPVKGACQKGKWDKIDNI